MPLSQNPSIPFEIPYDVKIIREKHFGFASILLRSDGITQINTQDDMIYTIIETKKVHGGVTELNEGRPILILHVPGIHSNADDESRKFLASKEGLESRMAFAFVLKSLPQRMVGNFYIKINKPEKPTRIFAQQEAAEQWLLMIKQKNNISK